MSSPITFSGFNDIDFNAVVTSLMQQASQPLVSLQNRQTALTSQVATFGTLGTKIAAMQSAAAALSTSNSTPTFLATTSDPDALTVSTGPNAGPGEYDIVVQALARAQVTASTSVAPDATSTVVASGGSLTIGGVEVTVTGDMTLQQLADAINATDDMGVRAAVVRTGASSYQLVLTSANSGAANAFTITNTLSGGAGVAFGDDDDDGVSGDSAADNAVAATDAALLVNNLAVTGASNTFEDVIPGLTFTARAANASNVIRVQVDPDGSELASKIKAFVTSYNDVISFLDEQRARSNAGQDGSIGRDPMLRQLRGSLRSALSGAHGTGAFTRLAEIGIEFTQKGTLSLNETRLNEAVAAGEDAVHDLVGGTDGAFTAIKDLLGTYSTANGVISTVKQRLTQQIASMDGQIQAMQLRLALERAALQRQFTEADLAISRLREQSDSLGSFAANAGLL